MTARILHDSPTVTDGHGNIVTRLRAYHVGRDIKSRTHWATSPRELMGHFMEEARHG